MPSFDAGWDFVAQLNISWPFQLPPPPLYPPWLHSVYIPTVVRPHSCHGTDATERFHWQIAFSRWFFKPQWHFNYRIQRFVHAVACALLTIHVHFFFLKSYTNRWGEVRWWDFRKKNLFDLIWLFEQYCIGCMSSFISCCNEWWACRDVPFMCSFEH